MKTPDSTSPTPHPTCIRQGVFRLFVFLVLCSCLASFLHAQAPAPVLLAHWTYDEEDGAVIRDQSGNDNHADIIALDHIGRIDLEVGNELWPALYFDGMEGEVADEPYGFVESAALADQLFKPTFSVSTWICLESLSDFVPILTKITDLESWDDGFGLYLGETGALKYFMEGEAPNEPPVAHARIGAWTHLCLTFDGATAKFYINGQLRSTSTPDPNAIVNAAPVRIGTLLLPNSSLLPFSPFHGLITDTRIYDNTLSDVDVLDLFTSTPVAQLVDSLDQGILDVWALFFGLNPFDPTLAKQILNQDGFTNLQKYHLGMNPAKNAQVSPKPLLRVYTPLEK